MRKIIGVALALVLVPALLAGSCLAIDRWHPRDRIVSGRQVWRCSLVGGSWPVEAAAIVGLAPGYRMDAFGAVERDRGWISVVRLTDALGSPAGEAAFVLGDGLGSRLGALDGRARQLAAVHSVDRAERLRPAITAARECLRRKLPE